MDPLLNPQDLRRLTGAILLDARPRAAFEAGHLPGALPADLESALSTATEPGHDPVRGGRHPLPTPESWSRQLGDWGIGPDRVVVAYDEAKGSNAAVRAWWMLRAAGHGNCAVLDGGLQAALAEGFKLTVEVAARSAVPPRPFPGWRLPTVAIEEVAACASDPSCMLLDVRSAERWRGETETLDPVAGRIPGSRNLPWPENVQPDGRFKSRAALREMYLSLLDGTPPERLVVHCGSGVTACHTLLALEAAGLSGAALYVGSWSEWCRSGRKTGAGAG